jgi:hypothetical protein
MSMDAVNGGEPLEWDPHQPRGDAAISPKLMPGVVCFEKAVLGYGLRSVQIPHREGRKAEHLRRGFYGVSVSFLTVSFSIRSSRMR